jgi:hypothetical protein
LGDCVSDASEDGVGDHHGHDWKVSVISHRARGVCGSVRGRSS